MVESMSRSFLTVIVIVACVGEVACRGQITENRPGHGDATGSDSASDVPVDAPTDGPVVSGRSCKDLRFCDDFEANTLGSTPQGWMPDIAAGTVAVGSAPPPSGVAGAAPSIGTKAVHLVSSNTARILKSITFTPNAFFGRARLWFKSFPAPAGHWNVLLGWGYAPGSQKQVADQNWYEIGGGGGNGRLSTFYLSSRTGIDGKPCCDCCLACGNGPAPLPVQKWTCVEWQMDGVKNEIRFWVDGTPIDQLTIDQTTFTQSSCGANPWIAPIFERMDIGWQQLPAGTGSMEMWVDDVALDAQRIGCGP